MRNMGIRFLGAVTAVATALCLMTGCDDVLKISVNTNQDSTAADSEKSAENNSQNNSESSSSVDIESRSCSPILTLGSAEAKAGETVQIPVTVQGADGLWAMCGIHFSYDDALTAVNDENTGEIAYEKGDAVKDMAAMVALGWIDNRPDDLVKNNKYAVFFTTASNENSGKDGEIVSFSFKIPDDATVGTVYNLEFFYKDGDMFTNVSKDAAMQKYAVENWVNGSITVTE